MFWLTLSFDPPPSDMHQALLMELERFCGAEEGKTFKVFLGPFEEKLSKEQIQKLVLSEFSAEDTKFSFESSWSTEQEHSELISEQAFSGQAGSFTVASSSSQSEQGESTILLAEGLGFGDGGHPTTALCLELLSKLDLSGYKNIFDIGTGSGVLITAAAKRTKQSSLFACDTEKNAMSQTQRTLELNSCAAELYQGDWKALRLESGLVVANLYLSFLEEILRDFSLESFDFLLSGASSSSLRELLKEIQAERHFKQFEFLEREGWAAAFFSA